MINLTGIWLDDDGGKYYLRQLGDKIRWYGESSPENPFWTNVVHGIINDNLIRLKWSGVPKGITMNRGELVLKIISPHEIVAIRKTGGIGGNRWIK